MKTKLALECVLLVVSLCLPAVANDKGNDAGNGGHGISCRGANGDLTSVQFFDLWYAAKELRLRQISSEKPAKELANEIVLTLYQADPDFFGDLLVSYANVVNAQVKIGEDLTLLPPQAFLGNLIPTPDTGCKIEPLAVYADSGVLLTSAKLWDFLERGNETAHLQQAALYVHESIGGMLRKHELDKLPPGTILSEEIRKRIARDTVNFTAMAFTPSKGRKLQLQLKRYRETGEVFEKPKLERIDTTRAGYTDYVYPESEAAWKEARQKCEAWKEGLLKRIQPRSEFAIISCAGVGAEAVHRSETAANPMWGYSMATITAVPKQTVVKFVDNVRSALIPYWPNSSLEAARLSWMRNSAAWVAAQEKQFGDRLYFASEGISARTDAVTRTWQWRSYTGIGAEWSSGITGVNPEPDPWARRFWYDDIKVGSLTDSTGEAYLFVDSTDFKKEEGWAYTIAGTAYRFAGPGDEAGERQAAVAALQSYEQACASWKATKYKAGAVFASCAPRGVEYKVNPSESKVWFVSSPTAYFYDE